MAIKTLVERDMGGNRIRGLGAPTTDTDAATKAYVDAVAQGLSVKESVRAATTGNISLSGTQTVDGVALAVGDRVLVKDQTTGANNGLWVVASGAWARPTDADSGDDLRGMFAFVEEGTVNGDSGWVLITDPPITVGTTPLTFAQFTGGGTVSAGAGLTKTGVVLDVGAGNGITVTADAVAVDPAVVVRKAAFNVGDGAALAYALPHNLGTQDVTVALYESASPFAEVEADVEHTSTNSVTIRFTAAPALNAYRAVVHG